MLLTVFKSAPRAQPTTSEELRTLARKYSGQEMAIRASELARLEGAWVGEGVVATLDTDTGQGTVHTKGPLSYEPSWDEVDYEDVARAGEMLSTDPRCKAIDHHIESPGGTLLGLGNCVQRWQAIAKVKPVRTYTRYQATSAAYELLCCTGNSSADANAVVGSVATLFARVDRSAALKTAGVQVHYYSGGAKKAWGSPYLALSEEEDASLRAKANDSTAAFQSRIAGYGYKTAEFWAEQQGGTVSATVPGVVNNVINGRLSASASTGVRMELEKQLELLKAQMEANAKAQAESQAKLMGELALERARNTARGYQLEGRLSAGPAAIEAAAKIIVAVGESDFAATLPQAAAKNSSGGAEAIKTPAEYAGAKPPAQGGESSRWSAGMTFEQLLAETEKNPGRVLDFDL